MNVEHEFKFSKNHCFIKKNDPVSSCIHLLALTNWFANKYSLRCPLLNSLNVFLRLYMAVSKHNVFQKKVDVKKNKSYKFVQENKNNANNVSLK